MARIKVLPQNVFVEIDGQTDLYTGLKANGFHINSTCGGCASCGRCIINIIEGEENLNEIPFEERQLLGNVFHITKERLSCQTTADGPVTIDISMHEQPKKTTSVKRRTKVEVEKIVEDRKEQRKQKPKKLGGGNKPKAFDYKEDN